MIEMKIRDLTVGSSATLTLLVKTASILLTGARKPYLSMELTDGVDSIKAVDWDWGQRTDVPEKNTIVDVTAQVTEWAGNKQLKLVAMIVNADVGPEGFAPKGNVEVDDYVNMAKMLMDEISHPVVRDIVQRAFKDNSKLWKTIPSAKGIHHAFVAGNLKHSVDVAIKAKVLAEVMDANVDLCIAGGLLQDFGKLWTYSFNGAIIEMTQQGMFMEHIAIGIAKLEAYRTPENSRIIDILQHLIASHHGKVEYGSTVTPMFLEAWIVAAADGLDAKAQVIYELNAKAKPADVLTEKSFVLENRQMFTQSYINTLLG